MQRAIGMVEFSSIARGIYAAESVELHAVSNDPLGANEFSLLLKPAEGGKSTLRVLPCAAEEIRICSENSVCTTRSMRSDTRENRPQTRTWISPRTSGGTSIS